MSFFDLIENYQDQQPEPVTIPAKSPANSPARGDKKPDLQQRPTRRSKPRPEKLEFLKPCPVCQGKEFTHGSNGGFFCNTCQPGIAGHPVIALGRRQPPEIVEGLPCAGCGSTTYFKERNGFIFDDGALADGWRCGSKTCHVKLLIGNKKADRATKKKVLSHTDQSRKPALEGHKISDAPPRPAQEKNFFLAAFPWIMDHLPELQAAGWTRPELFRRGKFCWPYGSWGIAWLSVWCKPGLQMKIDRKTGAIRFSFTGTHGSQVTQTVRPGNRDVLQV